MNNTMLMVLAGVAVWWFFIREKPVSGEPEAMPYGAGTGSY